MSKLFYLRHGVLATSLSLALMACNGSTSPSTNTTVPEEPETPVVEVPAPFGDTTLYVQGMFNLWTSADATTTNAMTYAGDSVYTFSATVTQAQIEDEDDPVLPWGFRVTDQNYTSATDFGLCSTSDALTLGTALTLCAGTQNNITLTLTSPGTYTFSLNASSTTSPVLTVTLSRPADFIRGADVSTLAEVEKLGGQCLEDGVVQDCLTILKNHGFNYIRLRLWNDPTDSNGNAYGGGDDDLATVTALAVRAKALGFKFLLDFHYSDFWVDPGKQFKPKAWEDMTSDELATAVHDYTAEVITTLKAAGVLPDMVQIGNEINSGMLWPNGKNWGTDVGGFDELATLLNAGIAGVKESLSDGEDVKIMLHLAEGGNNSTFRWWFDEITERDVDFDIIGMSYYPYWHGTLTELKTNMDDMVSRYGKDVVIAETSYGFTTDNGDSLGNSFGADEAAEAGYDASVEGQAAFLTDLMDTVAAVPNEHGLGIFYWEPIWLPVGVTWATSEGMSYIETEGNEGSAWDNQALFDFDGNALDSLNVFE